MGSRAKSTILTRKTVWGILPFLPVDKHLGANMLYDSDATNIAIETAVASVKTVTYKQGQTVVAEGQVVNDAQLAGA